MIRRVLITLLLATLAPAALAQEVYVHVLGIAQDGGYPQAGCYSPECVRAWDDVDRRFFPTSLALVNETARLTWLFEATPALPDQLADLYEIAPEGQYIFSGVFLTHAHIGHYAGLMHFGHEVMGARNVPVYAMPRMSEFLSTNGPWDQLVRFGNIQLRPLANAQAVELAGGVRVTPFLVPHRDEYSETVGFRIDGPNRSLVFIPDIDKWDQWAADIRDVIRSVDYALLDATFYADGELPGRDMSEIRHPFVTESMALFEELTDDEKSRIIFIHMNNSNPLLDRRSDEYDDVEDAGYRIATQGMRLEL